MTPATRSPFALALFGLSLAACGQRPLAPSGQTLMLSNVVDPATVNAVSRFNGCVGHAYPLPTSPNSAKNYFWPTSTSFSTNDALKEYAACDGTMRQTSSDSSPDQRDRGQSIHLFCDNSATSLRYFHLSFAPGLSGQHVRDGDVVGYAALVGTGQSPSSTWYYSSNFDIAVSDNGDSQTTNYFARLSPAALAAWGARGLTSVAQTINDANPACSGYSSDVGIADILSLSPAL